MSAISAGTTHLERMCQFDPRDCVFICGRKQELSKPRVYTGWYLCF